MAKPASIAPQGWMTASETVAVMAALAAGGSPARFVGGCVRDSVAGRPVKDIDIATAETPETVLTLLADAGIKAIPTGIDHGTVTAVVNKIPFEVTTLRRDVETDGRRAVVAFTDVWEEDAARRDFTMNALYADADGTVFDPTGGLADLKTGHVRFVGDAETRIREDVLRLLRYFRFYADFGQGAPDEEALAACRKMAPEIPNLSAERVRSELFRLLPSPRAAEVLGLMRANGVLEHVLPEAGGLDRLAALIDIDAAYDIAADPVRRLFTLVPADTGVLRPIADRLRLSNAERDRIVEFGAAGDPPIPAMDTPARRRSLYRLGPDLYRDLALLGWAGAIVGGRAARDAADWRDLVSEADGWRHPQFPVTGDDVLKRGVPSGERIGLFLRAVEAWWMAGDFQPKRKACLAELDRLIAEGDC